MKDEMHAKLLELAPAKPVAALAEEVRSGFADWLTDGEADKPLVIGADVGVGKSTSTLPQLVKLCTENPNLRVAYLVPMHKLARESLERFEGTGVRVARYIGADQPDPDAEGELMCRRPDDLAAVVAAGGKRTALCGASDDCHLCPFKAVAANLKSDWCGMSKQTTGAGRQALAEAQIVLLPAELYLVQSWPAAVSRMPSWTPDSAFPAPEGWPRYTEEDVSAGECAPWDVHTPKPRGDAQRTELDFDYVILDDVSFAPIVRMLDDSDGLDAEALLRLPELFQQARGLGHTPDASTEVWGEVQAMTSQETFSAANKALGGFYALCRQTMLLEDDGFGDAGAGIVNERGLHDHGVTGATIATALRAVRSLRCHPVGVSALGGDALGALLVPFATLKREIDALEALLVSLQQGVQNLLELPEFVAAVQTLALEGAERVRVEEADSRLVTIDLRLADPLQPHGKLFVNHGHRRGLLSIFHKRPVCILNANANMLQIEHLWPEHTAVAQGLATDGEGVFRLHLTDSLKSYSAIVPSAASSPEDRARQFKNAQRIAVRAMALNVMAGVQPELGLNRSQDAHSAAVRGPEALGGATMPKGTEEWLLRAFPAIDSRLQLGHFFGERGSNRFEECRSFSRTSRPIVPPRKVESFTQILLGTPVPAIYPDTAGESFWYDYDSTPLLDRQGYELAPAVTEFHPDPRVNAMLAEFCNVQVFQMDGRTRASRRGADRPVIQDCASSHATERAVDLTYSNDEWKASGGPVGAVLAAGMWPCDGAGRGLAFQLIAEALLRSVGSDLTGNAPETSEERQLRLKREDAADRLPPVMNYPALLVQPDESEGKRESKGWLRACGQALVDKMRSPSFADAVREIDGALVQGRGAAVAAGMPVIMAGWHPVTVKLGPKASLKVMVMADTPEQATQRAENILLGGSEYGQRKPPQMTAESNIEGDSIKGNAVIWGVYLASRAALSPEALLWRGKLPETLDRARIELALARYGQALGTHGVLPASPKFMAATMPDIWKRTNTAQDDLACLKALAAAVMESELEIDPQHRLLRGSYLSPAHTSEDTGPALDLTGPDATEANLHRVLCHLFGIEHAVLALTKPASSEEWKRPRECCVTIQTTSDTSGAPAEAKGILLKLLAQRSCTFKPQALTGPVPLLA